MKINCGPSPEARRNTKQMRARAEQARLERWHPFFAILPRRVGENDCRWLEWIERKGTIHNSQVMFLFAVQSVCEWQWEYRAAEA